MIAVKGVGHREHREHRGKAKTVFGFNLGDLGALSGKRFWLLVVFCLLVCSSLAFAEEQKPKWPGVDEAVVEKYAKELGREARDPYINTDQGDLLLFLFALAGAAGGFVMGYYWHKLFVAGKLEEEKKDQG